MNLKGLPAKVKFIGETNEILYDEGFTKNKIYPVLWDIELTIDLYKETKTITVWDDDGEGHEITSGDYEIVEVMK